jgi:hypothetical protein
MVVRVRFGRGPVIARRKGKNSRLATLAASLLTIASISCGSMGAWRIGNDLDLVAGDFVFTHGLLSHWQVWIGAAAAIQYAAWLLTRYARLNAAAWQEAAFGAGLEDDPNSETASGTRTAAANL